MDNVHVASAKQIWSDANVTAWGTRGTTIRWNEYVQQSIDIIPNRVTLVGSLAQFSYFNEGENNVSVIPNVANTLQRQHKLLHREGAVINITKWLAGYVLDSTTMLNASATTRDIEGNLIPPQEGTGKEFGFKINALNGRITSTVSFFDIKLTNQAVPAIGNSPISGLPYSDLLGVTEQKGWDWTGTFQPAKGLQLILNTFRGTNTTQTGAGVPNSYSSVWSAFGHYSFAADSAFHGLSLSLGANRQMGRLIAGAGVIRQDGATPAFIKLKNGTMSTALASYRFNKHFTMSVGVTNILDETFPVGYQNATTIDPSPLGPKPSQRRIDTRSFAGL